MNSFFKNICSKIGPALLFLIIIFPTLGTNASTDTKPKKILSMSPSLTEILFAVGAGSQIIAVDDKSTYPPEAPVTSLSSFEPNMEAIASYKPDLVVLSYDIGDLIKGLNTIGIETMLLPAPVNFEGILQQIRNVGKQTGNIEQSNQLTNEMTSQMKDLITSIEGERQIKIYHEIDENYYSASSQSFIGNIYKLLNFINIADQANSDSNGYPKLSPEYILLSNPDIIILPGKDSNYIEKLKKRPGWLAMDAVKKDRLLIIDADIGSRWGPRIIDFAKEIVKKAVLN